MQKQMASINVEDDLKRGLLECIILGMGDDYKLKAKNQITHNDRHHSKWDLTNTRIANTAGDLGCIWGISEVSKSLWSIISVYHENSRTLFHFMRERRHQELLIDWERGKSKYHYIFAYIQTLNNGFEGENEQLSLFELSDEADIERWENKTDYMLSGLGLTVDDIEIEVIVSFDERGGILYSARCVSYNENLGMIFEEDWTEFITPMESIDLDSSDDYPDSTNYPDQGLTFKPEALERAKNKHFSSDGIRDNEIINISREDA